MVENTNTYKIDSISLGDKNKGDKIVFLNMEEMTNAWKDIDNGKDIYVVDYDGIVTRILNKMINSRIADGTIQLCAKTNKVE